MVTLTVVQFVVVSVATPFSFSATLELGAGVMDDTGASVDVGVSVDTGMEALDMAMDTIMLDGKAVLPGKSVGSADMDEAIGILAGMNAAIGMLADIDICGTEELIGMSETTAPELDGGLADMDILIEEVGEESIPAGGRTKEAGWR